MTTLQKFENNTIELYNQVHALRLDGVFISDFYGWEGSKFGELRELVLGSEHAYYEGMSHIMATANNLRLLEFHGLAGEWMLDNGYPKPVLRPAQGSKVMRLHRLPFGTLRQGIKWIVPEAWETEMLVETKLHQPLRVLQNRSTVTALSLDNSKGPVHSGFYIRDILEALPNLHTLTLGGFELVESTLSGMTRPPDTDGAEFPRLSALRLHSSRVLDDNTFKSMVKSHPIRRLEVWDCVLGLGRRNTHEPDLSPLYLWLREQSLEVYISGP